MSAVTTLAGVALIVAVAREVFHSLFYPSGRGTFTVLVVRSVWGLTGRLGRRARAVSGPLAMVAVIALWVGLSLVGWALVYLPTLPGSFGFASSLDPATQDGFDDALYFAWVTQATLGYGDVVPEGGAVRVLAPLQATLGFGLFTMVATWVLSVYPALQRQRVAASLAHGLRRSLEADGGRPVPPAVDARRLERVADALHAVRVDLHQYPSTFYFAAPRPTLALDSALPFIASLAREDRPDEVARAAAAELEAALEQLTETLDAEHLEAAGAGVDEVLAAFRRHHSVGGPGAPDPA